MHRRLEVKVVVEVLWRTNKRDFDGLYMGW